MLPRLDLQPGASQTRDMAHTYILFDFGADEETAQKARHKLEGWKQAFRLDKKLQFKFDRGESPASEPAEKPDKPKSKGKAKTEARDAAGDKNGTVKLLVRLYFSAHEKLSEQRWIARIPSEEPFKGAAPKVVHEDEKEFPAILKQFDSLG
jgi:hypothetical protein